MKNFLSYAGVLLIGIWGGMALVVYYNDKNIALSKYLFESGAYKEELYSYFKKPSGVSKEESC